MTNIKDRVLLISENKGVTKNNFFKELGLSYANFKGIQKKSALNSDAIDKILSKYNDVSVEWLVTGKGSMLKNSKLLNEPELDYKITKNDGVPFYDVDFIAGELETFDNQSITPEYYMDIPEFKGCTAFRAYSDSMEKTIKSGSILFGTKIENWFEHLEYGQIYGIVSNDGRRYLKYIRKYRENPTEYYTLRSENQNYDDFEIPRKNIRSIWLVHGWLNRRT